MKLPPQLVSVQARFDRLSLRERLLVLVASIAVIIAAFNSLLTGRLEARRVQLLGALTELGSGTTLAPTTEVANDPTIAAYARAASLKARLASLGAQLTEQSAGMIPPKRMAEVIRDVLSTQQGVVLVSVRSLPALKLVQDAPEHAAPAMRAPFVHRVELVLQGSYLDTLAYLQALEALPWRFYWRRLDLTTTQYPLNRVQVELGTVSMDSEWLDL